MGLRDFPTPIEWKEEANSNLEPDPIRTGNLEFVSLPLLVK